MRSRSASCGWRSVSSVAALCMALRLACIDIGNACDAAQTRDRIRACSPARRCFADWERLCGVRGGRP